MKIKGKKRFLQATRQELKEQVWQGCDCQHDAFTAVSGSLAQKLKIETQTSQALSLRVQKFLSYCRGQVDLIIDMSF